MNKAGWEFHYENDQFSAEAAHCFASILLRAIASIWITREDHGTVCNFRQARAAAGCASFIHMVVPVCVPIIPWASREPRDWQLHAGEDTVDTVVHFQSAGQCRKFWRAAAVYSAICSLPELNNQSRESLVKEIWLTIAPFSFYLGLMLHLRIRRSLKRWHPLFSSVLRRSLNLPAGRDLPASESTWLYYGSRHAALETPDQES